MKKVLLLALVAAASIVVAAALAAPSAQNSRAATNGANPAKTCKAERASIGVEAFAAKYGTNPNKRNAFGKCVSGHARAKTGENEAEKSGKVNAAKKCRTAENAAKIGPGKTWRNFGACVKAQKHG